MNLDLILVVILIGTEQAQDLISYMITKEENNAQVKKQHLDIVQILYLEITTVDIKKIWEFNVMDITVINQEFYQAQVDIIKLNLCFRMSFIAMMVDKLLVV